MSTVIFKTKNEKQEAIIDLLSSEKKGSLTDGILMAIEQYFSPENIKNYPENYPENIMDEELLNRLANGEDIIELSFEFSEAKRVSEFRVKKENNKRDKKEKRNLKSKKEGDALGGKNIETVDYNDSEEELKRILKNRTQS